MLLNYRNDKIVFFDGACVLCNRSVDFILKWDRKKRVKFASLQSMFAEEFFHKVKYDISIFDSLVFYDEGEIYIKSDAVLKISAHLGFPVSMLAALRIIPRPVRDYIYDHIAKKRFIWFSKRDTCRIPEIETAGRILG